MMREPLEIFNELVESIRTQAKDEIKSRIDGVDLSPVRGRKPGPKPKAKLTRLAARPGATHVRTTIAPSGPAKNAARIAGQAKKRTTEEIEALTKRLVAHLKRNPKSGAKDLQAKLGVKMVDLRFPLRRLREDKKIKIDGEKASTTYSYKGD